MKKKRIEKEKKHFFRDYAAAIKAVIVFLILVGILVAVILFKPEKEDEIVDPSILPTNEKLLNNNDATCDGPEAPRLREEASKIYIQYEVDPNYLIGYMAEGDEDINGNGVIDTDPVVENRSYAIKLKVSNLTEGLYLQIENNVDDNIRVFRYKDLDDNQQIVWYETDLTFIRTYDVKIYSSNSDCSSQKYREFTTYIPRYNVFSRSLDCEFEPMKSDDVCQPFTWEDRTYTEDAKVFKQAMREYVEKQAREEKAQKEQKEEEENKKDESLIDKAINYAKDNYVIVAGAVIALVLVILLIIKRVKKK